VKEGCGTLLRPLVSLGRSLWSPAASPLLHPRHQNLPYIADDAMEQHRRADLVASLQPWLDWLLAYLAPASRGSTHDGVAALLGPSAVAVTTEVLQACGRLLATGFLDREKLVLLGSCSLNLLAAVSETLRLSDVGLRVADASAAEASMLANVKLATVVLHDVVDWVRGCLPTLFKSFVSTVLCTHLCTCLRCSLRPRLAMRLRVDHSVHLADELLMCRVCRRQLLDFTLHAAAKRFVVKLRMGRFVYPSVSEFEVEEFLMSLTVGRA
jgi:hypothetical protein